jgi:hypothetical protein
MLLREAVAETHVNNPNCVTDFKFKLIVLDDEDRIVGRFTDEEYEAGLKKIYQDWSVAERELNYDPKIAQFVMTIKIREVAE